MTNVWQRVYVTPEEVAARFHVTPRTVRRWAAQGKLDAIRVGRQWRIPLDVVERWATPAAPGQAGDWLAVCRRARAATPPGEDSVPLLRALREGRAGR
ncbi:MAG: DNA-binding protein [Chloroflexota bacterium]|nr:MAG: DNA-binding protein [Chloroflexota bacterium]